MKGIAVPIVYRWELTRDPSGHVIALALLTAVAVTAAAIPVRRATRIDPVDALRAD